MVALAGRGKHAVKQIAMLNYEVLGNPDGPTLALIHGFMSSNAQWDLNVDRLGAELRLVLIELRGHGDSPAPEDPARYERAVTVASIDEVREAVGCDAWWIGGHSLGGATAIRYAIDHPDRVRGLIYTNTRAAYSTPRNTTDVVSTVTEGLGDLRSLPYHPIHAKRFPEDLKAKMVAIADNMAPHAIRNTVAARNGASSRNDQHRLSMPVLLVNGRYERNFQKYIEVAREQISDLEIVELEGGHSVNIEQAEGFDQAVLAFVARTQAAAS